MWNGKLEMKLQVNHLIDVGGICYIGMHLPAESYVYGIASGTVITLWILRLSDLVVYGAKRELLCFLRVKLVWCSVVHFLKVQLLVDGWNGQVFCG